jgi:hypothetical protein
MSEKRYWVRLIDEGRFAEIAENTDSRSRMFCVVREQSFPGMAACIANLLNAEEKREKRLQSLPSSCA